jgi:hypothetical protein
MRPILLLVGLCFLLCGLTVPATAQGQDLRSGGCVEEDDYGCLAEGYSYVLHDTTSTEIYAESETDLTVLGSWEGYSSYVEVDLWDDSSDSGSPLNWDDNDGGDGKAVAKTHGPLTVGDLYEIDGYHWIYYWYCAAYDEVGNCTDPEQYWSDPGSTGWYFYAGAPYITSISPSSISIGASGQIVVQGDNLVDPFTNTSTPAVSNWSGSVPTFSSYDSSTGAVTLNYSSISSSVASGNHNLTLQTRFGTSNPATLQISDPSPVVNSISPNNWNAGQTYTNVQITGTGFGTNPSVINISDSENVSINANPNSWTSNGTTESFTATVVVDANAPDETVTFQVQNNGYYGNSFVGTNPDSSPGTGPTASANAMNLPAAQIVYENNGQDNQITSGTSFFVGQPVILKANLTLPGHLTKTSEYWTLDSSNVAVGGNASYDIGGAYTPGSAPARVTQVPNQQTTTLFWIYPGTPTVTYNYCASNGKCTENGGGTPATATFSINGPNATNAITTHNSPTQRVIGPTSFATMEFDGFATDKTIPEIIRLAQRTIGIEFDVASPSPSSANSDAAYQWVQMIKSDQATALCSTYYNPVLSDQSMLDNTYPYPMWSDDGLTPVAKQSATDIPNIGLSAQAAEVSRNLSAKMFLMWDPAIPPSGVDSCSPAQTFAIWPTTDPAPTLLPSTASTCVSIPVPIGTVTWQTCGDAINTLNSGVAGQVTGTCQDGTTKCGDNGTTWHFACASPTSSAQSYQSSRPSDPNLGYPTWTAQSTNSKISLCPR